MSPSNLFARHRQRRRPVTHPTQPNRPPSRGEKVRVVPLGGVEGVGENMTIYEYVNPGSPHHGDIIAVDAGLMFPDENMPGVDYVIPDTTYIQKRREHIKGIIVTHGHLDHTGAIPYILDRIGNPPIFGMPLTAALIRERLKEFDLDRRAKVNVVHADTVLRLGAFTLRFFRINHSIPDGVGIAIETPVGTIVHNSDYKIDVTPVHQIPAELGKIAALGNEGVILALSDSTNVEKPGRTPSERDVAAAINRVFAETKGRIIATAFASSVSRIQQLIDASVANHRKVAFAGLSMEKTVNVCMNLGYVKAPKGTIVKINHLGSIPPERVTIITAGSQGQENSAMGRMSRDEHRHVKINPGDTVVMSSSPVPGNEAAVQRLMSNLTRLGAKVVYNREVIDIHSSGHAYQEDLKLFLSLLRPQNFVPIHGEHYMLVKHAELAADVGIPRDNVFIMRNGQVLEVSRDRCALTNEFIPANLVMVDGLGVGDVGNVVLRDRQQLAQDGMLVVILTIDKTTERPINEPDIISRGFIYVRGNDKLIDEVKDLTKRLASGDLAAQREGDWAPLKAKIRDEVGLLLYERTERRPMILPVVIEA